MITRSWKNIVGVIYSCTRYVGYSSTLREPISGIFDVSGNKHTGLIARIAPNSSGHYLTATATGFNQATLFNSISTDTNINKVDINNNFDLFQLFGGKSKIVLGTGTTPVKYTDYTLESPITDGIAGVEYYVARSYNEENNTYEVIITATLTSSIDTTVSEVGIVKAIFDNDYYANFQNASYYYNVLAAREVLETPIDVKAGETFTVSIKIDI